MASDMNDFVKFDAYLMVFLFLVGFFVSNRDIIRIDIVLIGMNIIMILAGTVTIFEGISGFAFSGVYLVAFSMIVSGAITATGVIEYTLSRIFPATSSKHQSFILVLLSIAACSSFMNDVSVFLVFAASFKAWFPQLNDNADVRQFFIPMSFACLLGRVVTLIAATSNLVIAERALEVYPEVSISTFGIAQIGIPILFYGLAYIITAAEHIFPERVNKGSNEQVRSSPRHRKRECEPSNFEASDVTHGATLQSMTLACVVDEESPVIGKSINDAGLRNLKDIFLIAITRGDLTIHAVDPVVKIQTGDVLSFSGSPNHLIEICKSKQFSPITEDGNDTASEPPIEPVSKAKLLEGHLVSAVVYEGSHLIGKTPKDVNFRKTFDASIISIQRAGKDIREKTIGQLPLQSGDILVLLTGANFNANNKLSGLKLIQSDPSKASRDQAMKYEENQYLVGARVIPNTNPLIALPLHGKTIEEAGLRGLVGVSLVGITRASQKGMLGTIQSMKKGRGYNDDDIDIIRAPAPSVVLKNGDICWFSGGRDTIQIVRRLPGLESLGESQTRRSAMRSERLRLIEAMIAPNSKLIGATIRETRFRTVFGAAVVAIRRGIKNIIDKFGGVGNVELGVGDVLIVDAGPEFLPRHGKDSNFLIVDNKEKLLRPPKEKFYFVAALLVLIVFAIIASRSMLELVALELIAIGVMVALGMMTPQQARASMDLEKLIVIGTSYGLSYAIEFSGLGDIIGSFILDVVTMTETGDIGIVGAIYTSAVLFSLLLPNDAVALLLFPVSMVVQRKSNVDPAKIIYSLMLGTSASFLSPNASRINVMSMGLGPYSLRDFLRFGIPLQVLITPLAILSLVWVDQWYLNVLISGGILTLAIVLKWFRNQANDDDDKNQRGSGGDIV